MNGYAVYPSCTAVTTKEQALRLAKLESEREGYARVESCDTLKTVAAFKFGERIEVSR